MFRYALLILVFLALVVYVCYMAARGAISGQFRTISLILLVFLLILVGAGLYSNQKYYSVQTVQEEFTAEREDILKTIREHIAKQEYRQASQLAGKYREVNDPVLDRLFVQSKEAELLQRIEDTAEGDHARREELWRQLAEVTGKSIYTDRALEEARQLAKSREKKIMDFLQTIPETHSAEKALGFRMLQSLNPQKAAYHIKYNDYRLQIESRLQDSFWSDACSRTSLQACGHFGYLALEPRASGENEQDAVFGEIWGVSQRPKGSLISEKGEVAPEDGFYYIVHEFESGKLTLYPIESLRVRNPFARNSLKGTGYASDR